MHRDGELVKEAVLTEQDGPRRLPLVNDPHFGGPLEKVVIIAARVLESKQAIEERHLMYASTDPQLDLMCRILDIDPSILDNPGGREDVVAAGVDNGQRGCAQICAHQAHADERAQHLALTWGVPLIGVPPGERWC